MRSLLVLGRKRIARITSIRCPEAPHIHSKAQIHAEQSKLMMRCMRCPAEYMQGLYAHGTKNMQKYALDMQQPTRQPGKACHAKAGRRGRYLRRVMDMRRAVTGGTQCCATSAPFPFNTKQEPA